MMRHLRRGRVVVVVAGAVTGAAAAMATTPVTPGTAVIWHTQLAGVQLHGFGIFSEDMGW